MAKNKILVPGHFNFSCQIPVRITDINYGGHVGNDTVLSIIHEARMQFFKSMGYTEMDFGGDGLRGNRRGVVQPARLGLCGFALAVDVSSDPICGVTDLRLARIPPPTRRAPRPVNRESRAAPAAQAAGCSGAS